MKRIVQKQGVLYRNRYVFLAFLVPFFLMFYAYATAGFYPFGENQVAVIDMYHQYFPFINELHEKLQHGGSLLHTWNGGLGTNFISLFSYYLASPLYLLTVLVPTKYLMEAVTVIIMIKIGLAGAFMAVYLRGMHNRCDLGTVIFSTLYALCAFVMGYYWCLMWLDVVALLPLCILGLNRLIDRGEYKLYTIALAVTMLTNYYIGGMVCIFILFYYPILYFSRREAKGAKVCAQTTGKAVLFSLIGIAMTAVLLIPTVLSMQNTYYIDSEMPENSYFFNPLLSVITNLMPNVPLTVREGLPNIYCGLLTVMLVVFYMVCKSIPLRRRILNCIMLAFLFVSLNWNKLDFIWHGLHYPNQLPFRFSFVVSFLLVILAYEAFLKIREITPKQIAAVAAGGAFYILLAQYLYKDIFDPNFAYAALFLLFAYSGLLALYRTERLQPTLVCFLILLLVFGEMAANTTAAVKQVDHTVRADYFADSKDIRTLVSDVKTKDKSFYRMELSKDFTLNAPMLYSYPGVSQFSSSANSSVTNLTEHLGLEAEGPKNRYNYQLTNPVTNAMLNVKYIIGKGKTIDDEASLKLVGKKGKSTIYENKYDLSVGYMVNQSINSWEHNNENPFTVLNSFVDVATGSSGAPVFHPIDDPKIAGSNAKMGAYHDGFVTCAPEDTGAPTTAELTFTSPKTQQVYVFVESEDVQSMSVEREEGEVFTPREDCGAILSVGKCKAGEKVTLKINYEKEKASDITAYVYGLNQERWDDAYALLDDETLHVTRHTDRKIQGTIQAKQSGYFVTSIPYEKGWTLKVDGKEENITPFGDGFIAVPLDAGQHEITISYIPEGLILGLLVTLASIGLFIQLCFLFRRRYSASVQLPEPMGALGGDGKDQRWKSTLRRRRKI